MLAQQDALLDALDRALRDLTTEHGSAKVALGEVYRIGRGGSSWPIGGVKFEAGGPETTIHACHASRHARLRSAALGDRGPATTVPHDFFEPRPLIYLGTVRPE